MCDMMVKGGEKMALEELNKIAAAEKRGDEKIADAREQAKKIIAEAQEAASKMQNETAEQIKALRKTASMEQAQRSESFIEQQEIIIGEDCRKIEKSAAENMEKAVACIVERVVSA